MAIDFNGARQSLYGMAHDVCKNGREQNALLLAFQHTEMEMIEQGESPKAITIALLGIILDGLKHGNWPWVKNGVNTLEKV